MSSDNGFLQAMLKEPEDLDLRLIFADWLDEQDDAEMSSRGELLRLTHRLVDRIEIPDRPRLESRLCGLISRGARPVGPIHINSVNMSLIWVPPGTFLMGSPEMEAGRGGDEIQHQVTLGHGFFLGMYPVTQLEWEAVMGSNPSNFMGADRPVEQVSWLDCQEFCRRLSRIESRLYRLPTEEEWEYACRAGTTTPFHYGPTLSTDQANFDGSHNHGLGPRGIYRRRTTTVGIFPPNAFGLYDMHGNVWEWCADWYGNYWRARRSDLEEEIDHSSRVVRGGCWSNQPRGCRAAFRGLSQPSSSHAEVGCRVCMPLEGEP
jgi:uncharacterized protein (TIGR02996 family)